jgi:hypothetical protein
MSGVFSSVPEDEANIVDDTLPEPALLSVGAGKRPADVGPVELVPWEESLATMGVSATSSLRLAISGDLRDEMKQHRNYKDFFVKYVKNMIAMLTLSR